MEFKENINSKLKDKKKRNKLRKKSERNKLFVKYDDLLKKLKELQLNLNELEIRLTKQEDSSNQISLNNTKNIDDHFTTIKKTIGQEEKVVSSLKAQVEKLDKLITEQAQKHEILIKEHQKEIRLLTKKFRQRQDLNNRSIQKQLEDKLKAALSSQQLETILLTLLGMLGFFLVYQALKKRKKLASSHLSAFLKKWAPPISEFDQFFLSLDLKNSELISLIETIPNEGVCDLHQLYWQNIKQSNPIKQVKLAARTSIQLDAFIIRFLNPNQRLRYFAELIKFREEVEELPNLTGMDISEAWALAYSTLVQEEEQLVFTYPKEDTHMDELGHEFNTQGSGILVSYIHMPNIQILKNDKVLWSHRGLVQLV